MILAPSICSGGPSFFAGHVIFTAHIIFTGTAITGRVVTVSFAIAG
ncbi:TPA: hypothetical protein ACGTP8_003203 [Yersinia enterocolitica]|nr:hypothetical protein [Yersinia massiliensis]